jgi:four helix bundle protein
MGFIPPHGQYKKLLSYQKAEVVYDMTYRFCQKAFSKGDRTIDQMVQAARSGKQNIIEGSAASGTSKATEIKLTGVARASLEELLKDYEDFLRVHDAPIWEQRFQGSPIRSQAGQQTQYHLRNIPRICGNPATGNGGQHRPLPDSPNQLPA